MKVIKLNESVKRISFDKNIHAKTVEEASKKFADFMIKKVMIGQLMKLQNVLKMDMFV